MKKVLFFTIVLLASSLGVAAYAADLKAEQVSTGTLKKMIDDEASFVLIDARRTKDFDSEHIGKAISLPATDVNAKTLAEAAPDVMTKLVFYCQNVRCQASPIAARKALGAGYKYVYEYSAGIDDWKEHGYPTVKAAE